MARALRVRVSLSTDCPLVCATLCLPLCNCPRDHGRWSSEFHLAISRLGIGASSRVHRQVMPPAVQSMMPIAISVNSIVPLHKTTSKQAAYS